MKGLAHNEHEPLLVKKSFWLLVLGSLLVACAVVVLVVGVAEYGTWMRTSGRLTITDEGAFVTYEHPALPLPQTVKLPSSNSTWKDGDDLPIRFKFDNPTVVEAYSSSIVLGVILAITGALCTLTGAWLTNEEKKDKRRRESVKSNGIEVEAEIINIFPDYALTKRGREKRCRLDCVYFPNGEKPEEESGRPDMWLFTSAPFANPGGKIRGTVPVYVMPDEPDCYYVDLERLHIEEIVQEEEAPSGI